MVGQGVNMKRRFQELHGSALAIAILILFQSTVFSQDASIAVLETEFTRVDSVRIKLEKRRAELSERARSFAKEIEELKRNDDLSFFQRQRLNKLLKDSQQISNGVESIDSEINIAGKRYTQIGEKLLQLYDAEIEAALGSLERSEQISVRQKAVRTIAALRAKKDDLQAKIDPNKLKDLKISELRIDVDDSPRQIERKADLLKDQEEKLRAQVVRLEKQTTELERELVIRDRMSDFMTDIALFDQQEETLGNLTPGRTQGVANLNAADEASGSADLAVRQDAGNLFVGQKDFDFTNFSPGRLEAAIELLKRQQKQFTIHADSLGQQANLFYKTAKEMKKQ